MCWNETELCTRIGAFSMRFRARMRTMRFRVLGLAIATVCIWACGESPQQRADKFLDAYGSLIQGLYPIAAEANWKASTDVSELHVGERIGAEQSIACVQWKPLGH